MTRKAYISPDGVKQYSKPRNLVTDTLNIPDPSDAQLISAGWQIVEELIPEPEPLPLETQYALRVQELIAERYDDAAEKALLRQRDTKVAEFTEYFNYCEDCKKQAHREIYGE